MNNTGTISAGQALVLISDALDRVSPNRVGVADRERLDWVVLAQRVRGRVEALAAMLVAEADEAGSSIRAAGTPTTSWLGVGQRLSRKEAAWVMFSARTLTQHPSVGQAAAEGLIGVGQAKAINKVLTSLAPQLSPNQVAAAENVMLDLADRLDAEQLANSAGRVLNKVAPADANEILERRLQLDAEAAQRYRSLRFFRERLAVRFDGRLPLFEGEQLINLIDAHQEALRRASIENRDQQYANKTPEQRRADALINVIRTYIKHLPVDPAQNATGVPGLTAGRERVVEPGSAAMRAGDPEGSVPSGTVEPVPVPPAARVLVKLDYHRLLADAAAAGLIGEGQPLSAGELRRICCQAEIIPVVLGANSEVLDVGRARRLVTPAIRIALIMRDGGCVFPGCGALPNQCEAHHITPWWKGGATSLNNMALLCHHHHALVEPARYSTRPQWQIEVTGGRARAIPPPDQPAGLGQPTVTREACGPGRAIPTVGQAEGAHRLTASPRPVSNAPPAA